MQIIIKDKQQFLTCPHCLEDINVSEALKLETIKNFIAGFMTATIIAGIIITLQTIL